MRIYISIVLLFAVIFVMFMFVSISSDKLTESTVNEQAEESITVHMDNILLDSAFDETSSQPVRSISGDTTVSVQNNARAAIIVSGPEDSTADVLTEWCVYNKYRYRTFTGLPDADELSGYDTALFGDLHITTDDLNTLKQYAESGIPMIFLQLPSYETLNSSSALADFFGIKQCVSPSFKLDGVKIFGDFFLCKERIYVDGDEYGQLDDMAIMIPYYTLREGYDVYVTAVLSQQDGIANEDLPSLLWRTYTGSSMIFVVNSDIFSGQKVLGVITAFMSQAYGSYLYPVVNSQSAIVLDYPFFSNENSETLMEWYSRSTQGFCREILWPNIVKILKNYGMPYNFFAAPQLNYTDENAPIGEDVVMYWKEIEKLSGSTGLSLNQNSSASLTDVLSKAGAFFRQVLPAYNFTAIYCGAFTDAELRSQLDGAGQDDILGHVTLALSNFADNNRLFRFINDDVLSVMMTMDGYRHESEDDIQMIALETALGICTQQVDISRALFPVGSRDYWSKLSNLWSKGKTYFNDYSKFEDSTIYELEKRVRSFLALNFVSHQTENMINVSIDNFNGEAWFVLRVHNAQVKQMTNGKAERLSDTAYLIKAEAANVTIELQEINFLTPPEHD